MGGCHGQLGANRAGQEVCSNDHRLPLKAEVQPAAWALETAVVVKAEITGSDTTQTYTGAHLVKGQSAAEEGLTPVPDAARWPLP
jgi:hypothetical protein